MLHSIIHTCSGPRCIDLIFSKLPVVDQLNISWPNKKHIQIGIVLWRNWLQFPASVVWIKKINSRYWFRDLYGVSYNVEAVVCKDYKWKSSKSPLKQKWLSTRLPSTCLIVVCYVYSPVWFRFANCIDIKPRKADCPDRIFNMKIHKSNLFCTILINSRNCACGI